MLKLKIGDKAPNFKLHDQDGNTHQLSDYLGKKVVLFFYPKANTPTCTVEACNLRDNYSEFCSSNYVIFGISADPQKALLKFKQKYNFPYNLLSDEEKIMLNDYGVWGPKKFMGLQFDGILRTTFIIDEQGLIEKVIEKVKSKIHSQQILEH